MFFFKELSLEDGRLLAEQVQLEESIRAISAAYLRDWRGTMVWRPRSSGEYLYRKMPEGSEVCLGVRSRETDALAMAFRVNKWKAERALQDLRSRRSEAASSVRARDLGRVSREEARILEAVFRDGADSPFRLIGAGAIWAYEALSGGRLGSEALATGDMDVLLDPRRRVALLAEEADGGLLARLRSVDKTFEALPREGFVARSAGGIRVDVLEASSLRRWASKGLPWKGEEMRPVGAEGLTWLRDVPAQAAWVFSRSGRAVQVRVPDARGFALHKLWLSERSDRDPAKKGKDRLQAMAAAWMAADRMGLPQDPADLGDLKALPEAVRSRLPELVAAGRAAVQAPPARRIRVRAR